MNHESWSSSSSWSWRYCGDYGELYIFQYLSFVPIWLRKLHFPLKSWSILSVFFISIHFSTIGDHNRLSSPQCFPQIKGDLYLCRSHGAKKTGGTILVVYFPRLFPASVTTAVSASVILELASRAARMDDTAQHDFSKSPFPFLQITAHATLAFHQITVRHCSSNFIKPSRL